MFNGKHGAPILLSFHPLLKSSPKKIKENVLTRPASISPGGININTADGHLVHSIRDDGFRQTVLSEAMPRAFYRIRSGSVGNPMV